MVIQLHFLTISLYNKLIPSLNFAKDLKHISSFFVILILKPSDFEVSLHEYHQMI